jgi:HEAT repeat protein
LLLSLIQSPHARVAEIASNHLSSLAFMRVWEAWPRLDEQQRFAAGRALVKLDANFHRLVSERLAEPVRDIRLRALSMITVLNQGQLFEEPLIALARHPDHVVASAAVRALGTAESPAVQTVLEESLQHANNRVRANAIESLEKFNSQQHVHELLELAQSDDGRPRANAIKALLALRPDDALAALQRMLHDPRPEHRISALWVVEQMLVMELSRPVAELCVSEKNAEVKKRASEVVHKLIDSLRQTTPRLDGESSNAPRDPVAAAQSEPAARPAQENR